MKFPVSECPIGSVNTTTWSKDGRLLLLCGDNGFSVLDMHEKSVLFMSPPINLEYKKLPIWNGEKGYLIALLNETYVRLWSVDKDTDLWRYDFDQFEPETGHWSPDGNTLVLLNGKSKMALLSCSQQSAKLVKIIDLHDPTDEELGGTIIEMGSWSDNANSFTLFVGSFLQRSVLVFNLKDLNYLRVYN